MIKKILMFIYQLFIFIPIGVVLTIITALVVMVGCTFGDRKFWGYTPPKYWSKIVCRLALCSISVKGLEKLDKHGSYIFAPNHQSAFDIFLIYGYLGNNIKWVQKHTLRKIPFVGKASEIAGHVFVNQSSLKSMTDTIKKAEEELRKGESMVVFPEGSRTHDGKIDKFRRGAFVIAKEMKLPVVPVTLNGPFDVMKIHTYLINPGRMELVIHDPIPTADILDDDLPELIRQTREEVYSSLWEKYK